MVSCDGLQVASGIDMHAHLIIAHLYYSDNKPPPKRLPHAGTVSTTGPIMIDVVRDWVESLLRPVTVHGSLRDLESKHHRMVDFKNPPVRHRLPVGAKAVHCVAEMCVVLKCTVEDKRCPLGGPL